MTNTDTNTSTNTSTSNKKSHITFLLDRSGSMASCIDDTIGGYNTFLADQKRGMEKNLKNGEVTWSLIMFDHEYTSIYQNSLLSRVNPLSKLNYKPRGQTALYDAIGRAINDTSSTLNFTGTSNTYVIFVILTDGFENASKEFNQISIKRLIDNKESKGWEFIYLGANQDAITEAKKLGIKGMSAMTFDSRCMLHNFTNLNSAMQRKQYYGAKNVQFSQEERESSLNPKYRKVFQPKSTNVMFPNGWVGI